MIKFKSIILLLAAIQLFLIKPMEAARSNKTLIAKSELINFYENSINELSKKYCVKFKSISDQILKDAVVKQAKTPVMREFKGNMTQYQDMYPLYTRLTLHKTLLSYFTKNTIKYYYQNDKSSQHILQLLKNNGYNEILDQFEKDFMKFASTKFIVKFEQFKNLIPRNETKEWLKLLKWGQELKFCKSYDCYYRSFIHFDKFSLTAKEQLFGFMNQQLRNLGLFYGNSTYIIAKGVLSHSRISELSPDIQQKLKHNLRHFIQEYEGNRNITNFNKIFEFLHRLVLSEFLSNEDIPAHDKSLIREIFNEKGYAQFELNYLKKFKDFLEIHLTKKINDFKANLSQKEMAQERQLLEAFNSIQRVNDFEEKKMALTKLMNDYYGVPGQ